MSPSKGRAWLCALALLVVSPTPSETQEHRTLRLVAPDDVSTLDLLRRTLAEATTAIAGDGVSRTLSVETEWPPRSPRAAALAEELEQTVRDALSAAGAQSAEGAELLLDLTADERELRVTLVPREGEAPWWRQMFGRPASSRRWVVPLDAELRAFVDARPRASRGWLRTDRLPLAGRGYLAIGALEARHGETPMIVGVTGTSVELFRVRPGRRVRIGLADRVARPEGPTPGVLSRRPFATLLLEDGALTVRWRDRTDAHRLGWAPLRLEPTPDHGCPAEAHPWPDACATPVDGRDYFASALVGREGRPSPRVAPSSFYARWRGAVRRSDGSVGDVELVTNPRGRLVARTDDRELGLTGHGSALGVGDMDSDGEVEILLSGGESEADGDELVLLRLQADGGLRRLWDQQVVGRVLVAGAGDLDGDGVPALLAVEEGPEGAYLWVVR